MEKTLLDNEKYIIKFDGNIVNAKWKKPEVDLQTAQKAIEARLEVTNHTSYPVISDIRSVKTVTKEARDFLASEGGCVGIIAAAILIDSAIGSMIANFWLKINKPLRPTRVFTGEPEARKWLKQYINTPEKSLSK